MRFQPMTRLVLSLCLSVVLVFLAAPRMVKVWRVYAQPKPDRPPENFPIWPLWFVAWAFLFTRLAGGLFIIGLALNAVFPVFV